MSQRLQSIFFFLSALIFALLFFIPLADFFAEKNYLIYSVFGFETRTPGGSVPFDIWYRLPLLFLTLTTIMLSGYLAMGLFRAVRLVQFQKLLKIARIDIAIIAVWIAVFYGFVYFIIPMKLNDPSLEDPVIRWWAVVIPIVGLLLTIVAAIGLKKDIKKVRSTDRIR